MATTAASRQAQPHSGREPPRAYLTSPSSVSQRSRTLPTAGPGGTPQHREQRQEDQLKADQLHGKFKVSRGKSATRLPALQCWLPAFSAKPWVSARRYLLRDTGQLRGLANPLHSLCRGKHGCCGVGISQEDIFPISRDTNQCRVSNLRLILIKS